MAESRRIALGKIGKTFGLVGGLKVYSYTDPILNLFNYSQWILATSKGELTMHLAKHQPHKSHQVVYFEEIQSIEEATPWVNATVYIHRDELPKLQDREYYWADLEGLTVINQDNETLGKVDHLIATGANDVMVIQGEKEILIPYLLDEVIVEIDLNKGVIRVKW